MLDHAYMSRRYAKMLSQFISSNLASVLSDKFNIIFRKFRLWERKSTHASPFFHHISGIIGLCSEKQMIRINTSRVVALMKDEKIIGDAAVAKFPGDPVSGKEPAPARMAAAGNLSVSEMGYGSDPFQATAVWIYDRFCPETLRNRDQSSLINSSRHLSSPCMSYVVNTAGNSI